MQIFRKKQVSAKQNCSWSNKKKENIAGSKKNEAKHLLKLFKLVFSWFPNLTGPKKYTYKHWKSSMK